MVFGPLQHAWAALQHAWAGQKVERNNRLGLQPILGSKSLAGPNGFLGTGVKIETSVQKNFCRSVLWPQVFNTLVNTALLIAR